MPATSPNRYHVARSPFGSQPERGADRRWHECAEVRHGPSLAIGLSRRRSVPPPGASCHANDSTGATSSHRAEDRAPTARSLRHPPSDTPRASVKSRTNDPATTAGLS